MLQFTVLKSDCNAMRSAPVTAFCIAVGQTLFPAHKKRLAHGTIISKVRIEISCAHSYGMPAWFAKSSFIQYHNDVSFAN